jgi:hypothetical protein
MERTSLSVTQLDLNEVWLAFQDALLRIAACLPIDHRALLKENIITELVIILLSGNWLTFCLFSLLLVPSFSLNYLIIFYPWRFKNTFHSMIFRSHPSPTNPRHEIRIRLVERVANP